METNFYSCQEFTLLYITNYCYLIAPLTYYIFKLSIMCIFKKLAIAGCKVKKHFLYETYINYINRSKYIITQITCSSNNSTFRLTATFYPMVIIQKQYVIGAGHLHIHKIMGNKYNIGLYKTYIQPGTFNCRDILIAGIFCCRLLYPSTGSIGTLNFSHEKFLPG